MKIGNTKGIGVIWGIQDCKPIINIPPEAKKVKIRMRERSWCHAFLKFEDRVEQWAVCPEGKCQDGRGFAVDHWELGILVGVTQRKDLTPAS